MVVFGSAVRPPGPCLCRTALLSASSACGSELLHQAKLERPTCQRANTRPAQDVASRDMPRQPHRSVLARGMGLQNFQVLNRGAVRSMSSIGSIACPQPCPDRSLPNRQHCKFSHWAVTAGGSMAISGLSGHSHDLVVFTIKQAFKPCPTVPRGEAVIKLLPRSTLLALLCLAKQSRHCILLYCRQCPVG